MKEVMQGTALFLSMLAMTAFAEANELDSLLQDRLNTMPQAEFVGYETVDQAHADEFGAFRYLVMDFDLKTASAANLQQDIHSICNTVLNDLPLVRRLSDAGYDMISVSFDRQSQYDCL